MKIPLKQAIVEVASISGDRDILYSYVATENDHTVWLWKPYDENKMVQIPCCIT